MSPPQTGIWNHGPQPSYWQPASLPYAALAGVRRRRIVAVCIDFVLVAILSCLVWAILGLASFGLLWFVLPPLFPIIAFFYNGLTISGANMGTPGMRVLDLEVRMTDGSRVPFINAAAQGVLFYVSWMFPIVFLVSLVAPGKRCLHDILAGVIITRRPI
jgi:uncharacterized RDD family membrane protein YckC